MRKSSPLNTLKPEVEAPAKDVKKSHTTFERLRRHFLAGIFVIIPAFVAVYAVLFIVGFTDNLFGKPLEYPVRAILEGLLGEAPEFYVAIIRNLIAFVLTGAVILFVGWLSTFLFVKKLISVGEGIVSRIPLIKFFYNTPKEVLNTFAMSEKNSFQRVVMFEYPRRGAWALGFATGEIIIQPEGKRLVSVFMPTTPNPTTGFLMYIPMEDVMDVNVQVEEGFRMIISGGLLSPHEMHSTPFKSLAVAPELPPLGPLEVEREAITSDSQSIKKD